MNQTTIQSKSEPGNFSEYGNEDHKRCPYCGQSKIPFKLGVCICGRQVGNIRYVKNLSNFSRNYYSYVGEYDTAIEETFAGIEEWSYDVLE